MAKFWVDPPSGWQFGFPKVWDSERDNPVDEWLLEQGYKEDGMAPYVRMWPLEVEDVRESPQI